MEQKNGHVNFRRNWKEYEDGFGDQRQGDYWIGLRRMKNLTDNGYRVLTIIMQDCGLFYKFIRFNYFNLGTARERYPLYFGEYVSSNDFSYNNGMPFATIDRPDINNCAIHQGGGWWYNSCTNVLPTGHYYVGCNYTPSGDWYDGIFYNDWHGYGYSLKYIKMELSANYTLD